MTDNRALQRAESVFNREQRRNREIAAAMQLESQRRDAERAMLGAAVVPDRHRTNLTAESAGKFRLHGMRHQKIENRPRLDALEPFKRLRVIAKAGYVRAVKNFALHFKRSPDPTKGQGSSRQSLTNANDA